MGWGCVWGSCRPLEGIWIVTPVDVGNCRGTYYSKRGGVNEYGADDEFIKSEFIGEK